ncbi:MAG: protein kinase [Bacteroidota bacterium]
MKIPLVLIYFSALLHFSCTRSEKELSTVHAVTSSVPLHWYRQAIVELGNRINMFSPTEGIAISRGMGREFRGRAYRFEYGEWKSFFDFPYSDYPMIVSHDSGRTMWTVHHLTHDGSYRPVHSEFVNGKRREIALPKIMWDEIDHVMYKGIHQFDDGTAWLVGQQGHILFYDGKKWREVENPLIHHDRVNVYDGDLNDVFMLSKNSGWAVGRDGIIIRYHHGKWVRFPSPTQNKLFRVAFADENNGWAVGEKGTIIRWNGTSWDLEKVDTREVLNSLKVLDQKNIWVVGNASTLLHFDGTSWIRDESILTYDDVLTDIDVVKDQNGDLHFWIIGNQGIYTTSNSTGFSFTDITGQASLRRSGRGGIFFKRSNEETPDLLVLNEGGINLLYENNGKNVFSDVTESAGLLSAYRDAGVVALGDVNNDGEIDMLQALDNKNFKFYFGTLYGGFRDATEFSQLSLREINPNAAKFVDLDNDGNLDLYISNFDLPDQVFRNDGTGRFTDMTLHSAVGKITNHSSYGAAFGDFNNDGLIDLFIPYYVSYKNKFFDLFINRGDFQFSPADDSAFYSSSDISPTVAIAGDFNNDGYCDIFVHNQKAPPYLLVNDALTRFTNVAPYAGLTKINLHPEPSNGVVAVADVNNDGWIDIFDGSKLYLNSPEFQFTEVSERVGIQFTGNPSFADIDNDGDMDLFIGSSRTALGKGDRAVLFRNNLNPSSFAKIKVYADKSNRRAIGTKIFHEKKLRTIGLSSSPMLPQSINEEIFSSADSIPYRMQVKFPSGTTIVPDEMYDLTVYESGFLIRPFILFSKSIQRTLLLLDWRIEIPKLAGLILLWFGFVSAGRKYGTQKFAASNLFAGALFVFYALLVHLFAEMPTGISIVSNFILLLIGGAASIAIARVVIQKREAQHISHYKIMELIGAGGMGKVYKAIDTNTKQVVALKVLNQELLKDPENRRRLSAEGHLLSSFDHPNIVKVFEIGESNERGFIAMEFLSGGTLREKLEKEHPLSIEQIKQYVLQVCDGLSEVHSKGIIHRDLKTGNLMLDANGTIRIMDFGLSKSPLVTTMTSLGTVLGTLGYVAPEQVTSVNADHRTDIFSLGVIMYELLTKELPFKGENEIALIHSIFNTVPALPSQVRSDIPKQWDSIVMKCLAKDPNERFSTAEEVKQKLKHIGT